MKKTIDYLYRIKQANDEMGNYEAFNLYEAIKEVEDLIQENKVLIKTLKIYNQEMINLRIENQELKDKE